jgi:hypothetical protein
MEPGVTEHDETKGRPHEPYKCNEKQETLDKAHAHMYLHVIRKFGSAVAPTGDVYALQLEGTYVTSVG